MGHSSNLCTEIIEYTSEDEVAVCNLASIALPTFVNIQDKSYDFERLRQVTKVATRNLNKVIERNYYPVEEAKRSNFRHRPIGLGVQGLADAFMMMRLPFESSAAQKLNEDIFETIYFQHVRHHANWLHGTELTKLTRVLLPAKDNYSSICGARPRR